VNALIKVGTSRDTKHLRIKFERIKARRNNLINVRVEREIAIHKHTEISDFINYCKVLLFSDVIASTVEQRFIYIQFGNLFSEECV